MLGKPLSLVEGFGVRSKSRIEKIKYKSVPEASGATEAENNILPGKKIILNMAPIQSFVECPEIPKPVSKKII